MTNRHFAVIGDPIAHSLSPFFHQTALDILEYSCAYDADKSIFSKYVAYHVKKEDLSQFMNMFCGRKSTSTFRPLCLLKEGDSYANGLWEYDSAALTASDISLEVSSISQYNIPQNIQNIQNLHTNFHISQVSTDSQPIPMSGLSVTLPHKKEIMQYADRVTPLAMLVGAANTLYWDNGQLVAHNTDVEGFLAPLSKKYLIAEFSDIFIKNTFTANVVAENVLINSSLMESSSLGYTEHAERIDHIGHIEHDKHDEHGECIEHGERIEHDKHDEYTKNTEHIECVEEQTAIILGAGGAAAAVLVGLLQIPCVKKIYVCARNIEQAENLCEHIKEIAREKQLNERLVQAILHVPEVLPFSEINKKVDIVINTIPATLNGQSFNPRDCFEGVRIAYDLLYSHTPFLEAAKEHGVCIINGGEMFLQQGAKQFKLWTGRDMPQIAFEKVKERIARIERSATPQTPA